MKGGKNNRIFGRDTYTTNSSARKRKLELFFYFLFYDESCKTKNIFLELFARFQ